MPPTEQTRCADNGSISGDAIETPTDNANHASTRRAMIGALRKDCIGGLSQVRAPRRRDLGPPTIPSSRDRHAIRSIRTCSLP